METHYTQLDLDQQADAEAVEQAYARQRERYDPQRLAGMDAELRAVAQQRLEAIEWAYAVLGDPQRRAAYDRSVQPASARSAEVRRGLTAREWWYAGGGALAAFVLIAAIWAFTGRQPVAALSVPEVNRPAPAFTLDTIDGNNLSLSDYRGKVVLVNFWNTWCEPCKEETPALQTAYNDLADQGLVVIGINLLNQEQNGIDDVRAFTERYSVSYPIALDNDGAVSRAFKLFPLPTSYFIDPQGNIRYIITRTTTRSEVEQLFYQLREGATAQQ